MFDWLRRKIYERGMSYKSQRRYKFIELSSTRELYVAYSWYNDIYIQLEDHRDKTIIELKLNPDKSIQYFKHNGVMIVGEEQR